MAIQNDTSDEAQQVVDSIYRTMTPAEKFIRVFDAYQTGKLLAMAGIRMRNPDASEKQVWWLWAKQHLGEKLFNEVYGVQHAES
ncbi:MAG: hypothetical protein Q7T18_03060 [Sedimentisphaerales bacterium]|nr:hypothetical protein [Sedimentisphaerales bacterium]